MSENRPEINTTEQLVDHAYSLFLSREQDGNGQAFTSSHACEAMLIERGIDPVGLLPQLFKTTRFLPSDILERVGPIDKQETWTNFATTICYTILGEEMAKKFPDVIEEESRRIEQFDPNPS